MKLPDLADYESVGRIDKRIKLRAILAAAIEGRRDAQGNAS